ncbi:MAG: fimbrillin family protein [Bacteroidales bacterium]|nr:fimbrillin family protein [Bacteroidales bacterium]
MKKYIILIPLALAALLSCQKETDTSPVGLPMRVVPTIDGTTKASLTTVDLQEFWLNVDCPSDAAFSYCGKMSKSGTAWSASKQLYWKNETAPVNYSAAFFSGHDFTKAEFTSGADLSVPADQSTQAGLNAADLLSLKATSTTYEATTGGALPVELKHGLAKLTVELSLGSDFYDNKYGRTDNPVKAFTIAGTNLGFNFQPATGAVSVTASTAADITPFDLSYAPGTATAKTSVATYEAILVPQAIAVGDLTITFKVGANDYTWTNTDAITLSAGQSAKLPMSVTTAPPPPPSINGHEYVDMGEVTIGGVKKNLKWATCNVGADNLWDYGDHRKSVDYFNWGGGWHIPTDEEWQALLNGTYYSWTWTYDYLEDGSNHSGRIVTRNNVSGTDPCAGNSIFLPAAGIEEDFNSLGVGSIGAYWSSTQNTGDSSKTWFIYFTSTNLSRSSETNSCLCSVRPVSE